jgi:hypothetical protein
VTVVTLRLAEPGPPGTDSLIVPLNVTRSPVRRRIGAESSMTIASEVAGSPSPPGSCTVAVVATREVTTP